MCIRDRDTVTQIFAEKFAEEISELSDGKMKIQVYANSTLGGDRDMLETCADGDIPFVVQNTDVYKRQRWNRPGTRCWRSPE